MLDLTLDLVPGINSVKGDQVPAGVVEVGAAARNQTRKTTRSEPFVSEDCFLHMISQPTIKHERPQFEHRLYQEGSVLRLIVALCCLRCAALALTWVTPTRDAMPGHPHTTDASSRAPRSPIRTSRSVRHPLCRLTQSRLDRPGPDAVHALCSTRRRLLFIVQRQHCADRGRGGRRGRGGAAGGRSDAVYAFQARRFDAGDRDRACRRRQRPQGAAGR
mmetsp:Transcript_2120/g.4973  ORF Transcript_2120/g.4973 Transcript_2120/m.4973 type:complete len:218 (-) Transcript_2120:241-894(-)